MTASASAFFFNDAAATEIYTLSLHDALPILRRGRVVAGHREPAEADGEHVDEPDAEQEVREDRKSTRLNSSHMSISYAVFCLKKKMVFGLPFNLFWLIAWIVLTPFFMAGAYSVEPRRRRQGPA